MNRRNIRAAQAWIVLGALALLACLLAARFNSTMILEAYLIAWLFFLGLSLGSLGNLLLHRLIGGDWGRFLAAPFAAAADALPVLALLFVPVLIALPQLYPWAGPAAAADPLVASKQAYLNAPFFTGRAIGYFAIWIALAMLLRRTRPRPEADAPARWPALAPIGLILWFFTTTAAAVDWIMSLTPQWYSTIFGLLVAVGEGLGAFAFALILALRRSPVPPRDAAQLRQDLGNLLLTFVMLWAYLAFMQYLIIWSEDLPHEIAWYLPRTQTSWHSLALALILAHFAVPFAWLLFRRAKRHAHSLLAIAVLLLFAHWADVLWLVAPSFRLSGLAIDWRDPLATLGIGGVWLAIVLHRCGLHHRDFLPTRSQPIASETLHGSS